MRNVLVTGVGMTKFGKFPNLGLKELAKHAVEQALADSNHAPESIDYAVVANAVGGAITGQEMVVGQVCLAPLGIRSVPVINVENACASGSTAFSMAYQAVACGLFDVVLAVGVEKMVHENKLISHQAISRAADIDDVAQKRAQGEIVSSYFMDHYARAASRAIESGQATEHDFAKVAVKNQANGDLNWRAQYGSQYSEEDILRSPMVVTPLRLLMCSPISDGAAAVVLEAEEWTKGPQDRPHVRVAASQIIAGGWPSRGEQRAVKVAAVRAYEQAGIGPMDLDILEVHDATASAELELYEQLGLAAQGCGAKLIHDGTTAMTGRTPTNTSGGLLAKGHPIGATGLAQICELTWQLRGEAGDRQISGPRFAGPRFGLAQNGGGWVGEDNAAAAVQILESL